MLWWNPSSSFTCLFKMTVTILPAWACAHLTDSTISLQQLSTQLPLKLPFIWVTHTHTNCSSQYPSATARQLDRWPLWVPSTARWSPRRWRRRLQQDRRQDHTSVLFIGLADVLQNAGSNWCWFSAKVYRLLANLLSHFTPNVKDDDMNIFKEKRGSYKFNLNLFSQFK